MAWIEGCAIEKVPAGVGKIDKKSPHTFLPPSITNNCVTKARAEEMKEQRADYEKANKLLGSFMSQWVPGYINNGEVAKSLPAFLSNPNIPATKLRRPSPDASTDTMSRPENSKYLMESVGNKVRMVQAFLIGDTTELKRLQHEFKNKSDHLVK